MKPSVFAIIAVATIANSSAMMTPPPSATIANQMRLAIDLSQRANVDPTYASDACELWRSILMSQSNGNIPLPADTVSAAHGLYASVLARIGRDKDAIVQYQTSIDLLRKCNVDSNNVSASEIDTRMGLGKSLQRLLRYEKARCVFLDTASRCNGYEKFYPNHLEAIKRALICCGRLGDITYAMDIIDDFETSTKDRPLEAEIAGMRGIFLLNSSSKSDRDEARRLLDYACDGSASIMYKWLNLAIEPKSSKSDLLFNLKNYDSIQRFAEINNSAFDDPCLVYLDDKVLLHAVVLKSLGDAADFYPQSFVIPQELSVFKDFCRNEYKNIIDMVGQNWILKDRSGYGSHGNQVVSASDVIDKGMKMDEPVLCQRIIHPPMLINNCKFSLRIYVVYFPEGISLSDERSVILEKELFISTEGLVKFASADMDSNDLLEDKYMTNSGRGDGQSSLQYDLSFLKRELEKKSATGFENMWNQLEHIIQSIMGRYTTLKYEQFSTRNNKSLDLFDSIDIPINHAAQGISCMPKILGFDFMLDSFEKPWLLEVNRFPGLEPRSTMDAAVKATVIYDAWLAAADRIGAERNVLDDIRPEGYKLYSLVKLSTK